MATEIGSGGCGRYWAAARATLLRRRHCRDLRRRGHALLLQLLGDEEGEFQRLTGIEPRIAMRVIAIGETAHGDRLGAAEAFGDVLPRHLEMDAARISAFGLMHREEALHPAQDRIHRARPVTGPRGDRVAVHRIAAP